MDNMDSGFDDPRVIAMRITGKLHAEVIAELVKRLEAVSATGQKSLSYIDLGPSEGSELAVVREKLVHIFGIASSASPTSSIWRGCRR